MNTILHGKDKRWQLIGGHTEIIVDTTKQENFAFLASTGFGTRSSTIDLAKKIVDFLNAQP